MTNTQYSPEITTLLPTYPKILYIDGDILLYRACTNAERDVRWDEDTHILFSNFADAKNNFIDQYEDIVSGAKKHVPNIKPVVVFSGAYNWRKELDPTYKSHRKDIRKPLAMNELRWWVEDTYKVLSVSELEADDTIGIFVTLHDDALWSPDKDLKQIPGWHYRDGELVYVDKDEADYWHFYQTLVGDPADGYKGCPGVGAVKAEKILLAADTTTRLAEIPLSNWRWQHVVDAYIKAGLTEEDAIHQARLARILRVGEWSEKEGVKLWTPNG